MPDSITPPSIPAAQDTQVRVPKLETPKPFTPDEKKLNSTNPKDQAMIANMQKLDEGWQAMNDNVLQDFRRVLTKIVA